MNGLLWTVLTSIAAWLLALLFGSLIGIIRTLPSKTAVRHLPCVIFMDAGEIVEDAPKEQFFARPASPRAQTFLSKILSH